MPQSLDDLPTPALLIDRDAMERNLQRMQSACSEAGVELWPHIKTHKLVPVLRRQLEVGATGAVCAKIGEAEVMIESGVRRLFIAHSLVDKRKAARLRALDEKLDQLVLAVTSAAQFAALEEVLAEAEIKVSVLMAVDTGLGREGVRDGKQARELADLIRGSERMDLIGLYTHEGHAYTAGSPEGARSMADEIHSKMQAAVEAVGGDLPIWPGCSVTAAIMAGKSGVQAVRPGSYVFGDLSLTESTGLLAPGDAALSVLATVVDLPEPGLALIDAGSKVFSSDKSAAGIHGRCREFPEITVARLNEEHGYLHGEGVDELSVGQRLRFTPAHACTVMNLTSKVRLVAGDEVLETWPVDARGCTD